jgi:hypothetical protein
VDAAPDPAEDRQSLRRRLRGAISTDLAHETMDVSLVFVGGPTIPGHLEEGIFGEHVTIVRLSGVSAHRATCVFMVRAPA